MMVKFLNHRLGRFHGIHRFKSVLSASSSISVVQTSCPYVSGSAVFKARTLYNTIVPMAWSDKFICNAVGVNKNGKALEEEGVIDQSKLNELNQIGVKIYPNPASTQLNIEYNLVETDKAQFLLFDILGRELLKLDLQPNVHKVSFSMTNQKPGIYIGKYIVNGVVKSTHKIIKE